MNKIASIKAEIKGNKYVGLILFLLFVAFFTLNYFYPIYIDDWSYSFMMDGKPLANVTSIIENQYNHYFLWGGRSIVHIIAQYLLYIGSFWGNFLNTAAYISLVSVIYFISIKDNKNNLILLVWINILIWFLTPSLGEDIFWITGSANYLWGCLIIIFFMYTYCSYYFVPNSKDGLLKQIAFFFFGLIAGWTNENMAVALIFFIFGLFLLIKIDKKVIPRWAVIGLIGVIIGCVVMLIAPGNYIRNNVTIDGLVSDSNEPKYMFYFYRFISVLKNFFWYGLYLFLIYLFVLLMYIRYKKRDNTKKKLFLSLLFFVTSMVATFVMIAAPIFPERVWFGIIICMILAICLLYANLDFSVPFVSILFHSIFSLLFVLFLYSYTQSLKDFIRVTSILHKREQIIEKEREKGITNIIIYGKFETNTSIFVIPKISDLPLDSTSWMGKAYGRYHQVNSITIVP